MRNVCKCYNCSERCIGCHSTCEKYLDFKKAKDVINKKIKLENILYFRSRGIKRVTR